MATTIAALYEITGVSIGQKEYFFGQVRETLASFPDKKEGLKRLRRYLYTNYDYGGHSWGRSLRSLLLEAAMRNQDRGEVEREGEKIALLVAMYHDQNHIKKNCWYDFPISDEPYESRLQERVWLTCWAYLLGIENKIPDISHFTKEDFFTYLKED